MLNLVITPTYNEIDYLPLKLHWCKVNELPFYVVDNYSTDGTWEYIQQHQSELLGTHQVDTDNSFDLRTIQRSLMQAVHQIRPDWLIYMSADLFPVTEIPLNDYLEMIDLLGYTVLRLPVCNFNHTGERPTRFDPLNTFYYIQDSPAVNMICKYHPKMTMNGDYLGTPHSEILEGEGVLFNFGFTKSRARRAETLRRRERAWEKGLRSQTGRHYLKAAAHQWRWKKADLQDIRTHDLSKYYYLLKTQLGDLADYHPLCVQSEEKGD